MRLPPALFHLFDRLVVWLAAIGGLIIVVQMTWISYGVFARYVLNQPDRMVTEATALLLFPVAFLGLGFALRENAYPRVTLLIDLFPLAIQRWFAALNLLLMLAVGSFFSIAATRATLRSISSGSSSEILDWPRYAFWIPSAVALIIFSLYVALRLVLLFSEPPPKQETP